MMIKIELIGGPYHGYYCKDPEHVCAIGKGKFIAFKSESLNNDCYRYEVIASNVAIYIGSRNVT